MWITLGVVALLLLLLASTLAVLLRLGDAEELLPLDEAARQVVRQPRPSGSAPARSARRRY